MKYLIVTLTAIFLLSSCSREEKEEGAIAIEINPAKVNNDGFSEHYKLDKLIRLENHPESYFGDARKIIISNDKIYIHQWGQARVINFQKNFQTQITLLLQFILRNKN